MKICGNAEDARKLADEIGKSCMEIYADIKALDTRMQNLKLTVQDKGIDELESMVNLTYRIMQTSMEELAGVKQILVEYAEFLEAGADCDSLKPTQYGIERENKVTDFGRSFTDSVAQIFGWIKEINPNYNPFLPPKICPYNRNCGSCAFAVECRLNGQGNPVATSTNIGTDAAMEDATGKKCEYMSLEDIEKKLYDMGAGSHLIVGINRYPTPFGKPQAGHWFNAYYDGNRIYVVDGQCGKIFDWPHDYGDISEWCALV